MPKSKTEEKGKQNKKNEKGKPELAPPQPKQKDKQEQLPRGKKYKMKKMK